MAFIKLDLEILASDLSDSEKLLYSLIKSRWDVSQLKDDDGKKFVILTQKEIAQILNWEFQKAVRIFASLKSKNLLSVKRCKNAKNAIFFDLDNIKNDNIKNDNIKNDNIKNDNINLSKMINTNLSKTINSTYIQNKENRLEKKNSFSASEKSANDFLFGNSSLNRWLISSDKPAFIRDEVWADYCAFKREKNQRVTKTELKAFLNELETAYKLGVDVNARIIECIAKGYKSPVFEPKTSISANNKAQGVEQSINALNSWATKKIAENEIIEVEVIDDATRIHSDF